MLDKDQGNANQPFSRVVQLVAAPLWRLYRLHTGFTFPCLKIRIRNVLKGNTGSSIYAGGKTAEIISSIKPATKAARQRKPVPTVASEMACPFAFLF